MIKGTLQMAMDFAKRKNVPHETYARRTQNGWQVIYRGPKYCNVYVVTEYDEDGLRWLRSHDRTEESNGPQTQTDSSSHPQPGG